LKLVLGLLDTGCEWSPVHDSQEKNLMKNCHHHNATVTYRPRFYLIGTCSKLLQLRTTFKRNYCVAEISHIR